MKMLIYRGSGIVIVPRIHRLYARIRLKRQRRNYVREAVVIQPGRTVIGGSARPHPVTRRTRTGRLTTSRCPFALVIPHREKAAGRAHRNVRLPLGFGRIGIAIELERGAKGLTLVCRADVKNITRIPGRCIARVVDIVNYAIESGRFAPTFVSPISVTGVHRGEIAGRAAAWA